ncbi:hypothetical protein J8F10_05945 [Gemmata sp. G18]|uniref:Carboxypeptidase regulatory-like domain-containing protein n=1 Tax=Gemmata palustris TaxID=2822762 RepID=A0ABS5BPN7_9BACT|nr:hypothetical protein [Gemmata palustris]MBP3954823.1 hypothetical protein [Gemmata palustris]
MSGSLTYKGQPIKAGTMAFHTPEGTTYAAQISTDGTYSAADLPEGELVVTVNTEHLNPARKPPAATGRDTEKRMKMMQSRQQPQGSAVVPDEPYIKIPEKYSNPKTSPLTITLQSGRQVHNFDLD